MSQRLTPGEEVDLAKSVRELRRVEQTISDALYNLSNLISTAHVEASLITRLSPAVSNDAEKLKVLAMESRHKLNSIDVGGLMIRCGRLSEAAWEKRISAYP